MEHSQELVERHSLEGFHIIEEDIEFEERKDLERSIVAVVVGAVPIFVVLRGGGGGGKEKRKKRKEKKRKNQ